MLANKLICVGCVRVRVSSTEESDLASNKGRYVVHLRAETIIDDIPADSRAEAREYVTEHIDSGNLGKITIEYLGEANSTHE